MSEPSCPSCGEPVAPVTRGLGPLNAEQSASVRAGDWFCRRCPESAGTAEAAKTGYAYFWDGDVTRPEPPTCPAFARVATGIVCCDLESGHEGDHRDSSGAVVYWRTGPLTFIRPIPPGRLPVADDWKCPLCGADPCRCGRSA